MDETSQRRIRLLLGYLAISLPLVVYGAVQSLQLNANSPIDWVDETFEPRTAYDAFSQTFGPGDVVVASWDGCTVDDPRLDALVHAIRTSNRFRDESGQWYFHHVVSGRELILQLTTGSAPLPREQAINRLRGTMVGPDSQTTCVTISFTSTGLQRRQELVTLLKLAIEYYCAATANDLHLAGPVIDGLSVDVASKESLDRFALPSALVVLVGACLFLRTIWGGLSVFGVALYSQAATLALIHFGGETMSALHIVLPPLIQVLAIAGGIHLANYYFDARQTRDALAAAAEALRRGWLPCLLSSVTTALGMASLMVSGLSPIRSFGRFSAAGVLISAALMLGVLPWLFSRLSSSSSGPLPASDDTEKTSHGWNRYTDWLARYHGVISLGGLALVVGVGAGVSRLASSVRIETLFGQDSRIVSDYAWLERHVAPLVPIEVVVRFPKDSPFSAEQRLTLLGSLSDAASELPEVGGTLSATTLLPALPKRESLSPEAYAQVVHQIVLQAEPAMESAHLLFRNANEEQWRLSVFVSALGDMDYGDFLAKIGQRLNREIALVSGGDESSVTAEYTGIMPLVHQIQRRLLADLASSFVLAFVLIALVMTLVQADLIGGLIAMVPNVFPTLILFGAMGWSQMAIDIGAVMTASVALGIAVDDTLHFLIFFRRGVANGLSRRRAVAFAGHHCGRAMVQTSVICSAGMVVFAMSDFIPMQRFAGLLVALMGLALVGDLLLLPALLIGPAGRWVANTEPSRQETFNNGTMEHGSLELD